MPTAKLSHGTVNYVDVGQGFPLLMGHSYLWDHKMWNAVIDELSKSYRLIATDLWGHGTSSRLPPDHKDLRDLADDHLELMDHLKIERFGVVGLSVGGMWGFELAFENPVRVACLVLADTFLGAEPEDSQKKYDGMLDALKAAGAVSDALTDEIAKLMFCKNPNAAAVAAFKKELQACPKERILDSIEPLGRMIFHRRCNLARIHEVTLPTLIITGEEDACRPPAEGALMAKYFKCNHVVVPGAGHISAVDQPAAVIAALKAFLDPLEL